MIYEKSIALQCYYELARWTFPIFTEKMLTAPTHDLYSSFIISTKIAMFPIS